MGNHLFHFFKGRCHDPNKIPSESESKYNEGNIPLPVVKSSTYLINDKEIINPIIPMNFVLLFSVYQITINAPDNNKPAVKLNNVW